MTEWCLTASWAGARLLIAAWCLAFLAARVADLVTYVHKQQAVSSGWDMLTVTLQRAGHAMGGVAPCPRAFGAATALPALALLGPAVAERVLQRHLHA